MWIFESLFQIKELEALGKLNGITCCLGQKRQSGQQACREQSSFNYWHIMTFQICAQIGPIGKDKMFSFC